MMKLRIKQSTFLAAMLVSSSSSFSTPSFHRVKSRTYHNHVKSGWSACGDHSVALKAASVSTADDSTKNEVERLRSMAAKLRSEAAVLEAEQVQAMEASIKRLFELFDTNQDGKISREELKVGLEKRLKQNISESQAGQLMKFFDKSGDGALQLDEFVGTDQMRNRLEAFGREERALAREKIRQAAAEEEATELMEAQLAVVNDGPPTTGDKIVSVLPYLFPLLDAFQYARFIALDHQENPLVLLFTLMYSVYRSIPFGGLISYAMLTFFSGRPDINRLVRFNMQQSIFLDIALFFPGLLLALYGLTGQNIPTEVAALSNDAVFLTLVATIGYTTVSSLFGITPDKIPFISEAVNARVPTVDTIAKMMSDERESMQINGKGTSNEESIGKKVKLNSDEEEKDRKD